MQTSTRKLIREMTPEELEAHVGAIYTRHKGVVKSFTLSEHKELRECRKQYLEQTGREIGSNGEPERRTAGVGC